MNNYKGLTWVCQVYNSQNFLKIDHVGVRRAAEFLLGEDADYEDLQAEVVGFITRFVDTVTRK
jgi:hypothetical protein